MSSIVCQGLQMCLDEPPVLRLKLAPPNFNFSRCFASALMPCVTDFDPPNENPQDGLNATIITTNKSQSESHKNFDMGGWACLQSLGNITQNTKETIDDINKIYVHPLVKRSSSKLSEKSLEMCTESLGSETGSIVSESSEDSSLLSMETVNNCEIKERSKLCDHFLTKRKRSFPPSLTSISGSNGVQIRPHREGGRLIVKAVIVSTCSSYFHAERSEGRLRLSLFKDRSPICEKEEEEKEEEEGEEEEEEEEEYREEVEGEYYYGVETDSEEQEEVDGDKEEEACWGEDTEGNNENVGGEMGIGKLPRPSMCKETERGHEGLLNWEPFWVAT
ncbi:DUF3049 domain-containing protein [Cephalotus follicularis]|uniref:DUF3049 domain-containing protein n=1 Tax=Cephalotus follicularis TaxID=3775 RepID=A0A1Q3APW2_CEPFO|nr:DUF3049 domain-containing protein [Cephalotus follicularis]